MLCGMTMECSEERLSAGVRDPGRLPREMEAGGRGRKVLKWWKAEEPGKLVGLLAGRG